jgi:hypothetical protein
MALPESSALCASNPVMKYHAFMSYSQAADGQLAPALQSAIQSLARRWPGIPEVRICRDKHNLAAHPQLWRSIEDLSTEAEFFILLASPEAAQSPGVCREIKWWLTHRSMEKILVVATGGELRWKSTPAELSEGADGGGVLTGT